MTCRKQTVQGECFMNHRNMKIARDDSAPLKPRCSDSCGLPLNASERISEQALIFSLEGGRCSSWGLLHCDDRRSPQWASRDGSQHDRSRSDTVMISMNFNSYASLVIFFHNSCFVLFCFWTWKFIYYTSVSYVWFLLPYVSLQSNWAWKPLELGMSISFSLWGLLSLLTLQ